MEILRSVIVAVSISLVGIAHAQEGAWVKPSPEHERWQQLAGTWDATVRLAEFGGQEAQGVSTWTVGFGGFHLVQEFQGDFGGMPFLGHGVHSYCPVKKKYITTWVDSMSASPLTTEGTLTQDNGTLVETGNGVDQGGRPEKVATTTEMLDKDTIVFKKLRAKDGKFVEMLSITYRRKK